MKIIHNIYIYRDNNRLPEIGWFQACFMCCAVTSYTRHFDTIEKEENDKKNIYKIYVYICPQCERKFARGDEQFILYYKNKCKRYINKHFFTYP